MITVHHLTRSRSHRILWLLEELEIPYQFKIYQRHPVTQTAPPELVKIHPLGKSPVITDGKYTIAESGAIIEYIIDHYGKGQLRPQLGSDDYLKYQYYMHYTEGSLMPPLVLSLIFNMIPKQPMPFFIKPVMKEISRNIHKIYINPQIHLNLKFLESELEKNKWFSGSEFSAADIQISFAIMGVINGLGDNKNYPKLRQFIKSIQARPAYKKAIEKGGPVEF